MYNQEVYMVDIKEATTALKNRIKTIKTIKECRDYGDSYLFVAFETNTPESEIDPFYLVNKNTATVKKYNIAEDTNKFFNAPIIKI